MHVLSLETRLHQLDTYTSGDEGCRPTTPSMFLHTTIRAHSCLHIYVSGLCCASSAVASLGAERTSWARSLTHTCLGEPGSHRNRESDAAGSRQPAQAAAGRAQSSTPRREPAPCCRSLPWLRGLPGCSHLQKNLVGESTLGIGR